MRPVLGAPSVYWSDIEGGAWGCENSSGHFCSVSRTTKARHQGARQPTRQQDRRALTVIGSTLCWPSPTLQPLTWKSFSRLPLARLALPPFRADQPAPLFRPVPQPKGLPLARVQDARIHPRLLVQPSRCHQVVFSQGLVERNHPRRTQWLAPPPADFPQLRHQTPGRRWKTDRSSCWRPRMTGC